MLVRTIQGASLAHGTSCSFTRLSLTNTFIFESQVKSKTPPENKLQTRLAIHTGPTHLPSTQIPPGGSRTQGIAASLGDLSQARKYKPRLTSSQLLYLKQDTPAGALATVFMRPPHSLIRVKSHCTRLTAPIHLTRTTAVGQARDGSLSC